jgi:hypothetical protein
VQLAGDEPDATHQPSMSGITCFDVRADKTEPGSQPYVITETGTATITSVDWSVAPSSANLLTSNSVGGTKNETQTLVFNDRANLSAAATPTAQTVTVTAYITYNDAKVVQISKTVEIQNASCCEGTIVYSGNLCWYKEDSTSGAEWPAAPYTCSSGWRVPTLTELQDLWTALDNTRFFSRIGARGVEEEPTTDMRAESYWSSTVLDGGLSCWMWYFGSSGGKSSASFGNEKPVRCVRSL